MPRKAPDHIVTYREFQPRRGYRDFVTQWWQHYQGSRLPEFDAAQGQVRAVINHGRWLVECLECNGAMIVDPNVPFFICVECGSPENAGNFYNVVLPVDRNDIETELLKRPGMPNRNWLVHETVEDLRRENQERVISEVDR